MTTQISGTIPGGGPTTGAMAQLYQCAGAPVAAVNDVQTITVDSCTHSTLTLKGLPGGLNYTAAQDVSTAALATALNALLGAGSVGVTGTYSAGAGGTYIITWSGGNYAGKTMGLLSVSAVFVGGSSPTVAIVHTTPGVAATFAGVAPPGALLADTTNKALYINAGSQLVPNWSNTANTLGGAQAITGTSADAFDVGQNGTSNPALQVDTSASTSRTGIKVKSAAAAAGAALSTISSGTDENLTIDAKGAGTITLNATATGGVRLARAATLSKTLIFTPSAVSALAVDVAAGVVYTKSIAADSSFTASAAGTAGQMIVLIISVDGTQRVATFSTNFNSVGTLTIPANKIGTITFISDGTAFREIARAILS